MVELGIIGDEHEARVDHLGEILGVRLAGRAQVRIQLTSP